VYRSWQGEIGRRNEEGLQLFEVKEQHGTRNGGELKQIKEGILKDKKEGGKNENWLA
jgi:hypothetical protein